MAASVLRSRFAVRSRPWDTEFELSSQTHPDRLPNLFQHATSQARGRAALHTYQTPDSVGGLEASYAVPKFNTAQTATCRIQQSRLSQAKPVTPPTFDSTHVYTRLHHYGALCIVQPLRRLAGFFIAWRLLDIVGIRSLSAIRWIYASVYSIPIESRLSAASAVAFLVDSVWKLLATCAAVTWAVSLVAILLWSRYLCIQLGSLKSLPLLRGPLQAVSHAPNSPVFKENLTTSCSDGATQKSSKINQSSTSFKPKLNFLTNAVCRAILGGVAATAVTLATRLTLPSDLDLLNCVVLSAVAVLRPLPVSWNQTALTSLGPHRAPIVVSSRPLEASLILFIGILVPLAFFIHYIPGAPEVFQILGAVFTIPNVPLLLLARAPRPAAGVWPQLLSLCQRATGVVVTDFIFLTCLDNHATELQKIPFLSLLRSSEEFEVLQDTPSFFSKFLVLAKLQHFSQGSPAFLPASLAVGGSLPSSSPALTSGFSTLEDSVSKHRQKAPGAAPLLPERQQVTHIAFGLPDGAHEILSIAATPLKNTSTVPPAPPAPNGVLAAGRRQPAAIAALSTVAHHGMLRYVPKSALSLPSRGDPPHSVRESRNSLWASLNPAECWKTLCGARGCASTHLSGLLNRVLPQPALNILHTVTGGHSDKYATLLFWNGSPFECIPQGSEFFDRSAIQCLDVNCSVCSGGHLILNYWIHEVLLNTSTNQIWTAYIKTGAQLLDTLQRAILLQDQLDAVAAVHDDCETLLTQKTRKACTTYTLSLELLTTVDAVFAYFQTETGPSIAKYMTQMQALSATIHQQRSVSPAEDTKPLPSSLDSRLRPSATFGNEAPQIPKGIVYTKNAFSDPTVIGSGLAPDFTTKVAQLQFERLRSENALSLALLLTLAEPFCRGFAQWIHIATLLAQKDKIQSAVRQILPCTVKLAETLRLILVETSASVETTSSRFSCLPSLAALFEVCLQLMERIEKEHGTPVGHYQMPHRVSASHINP